MADSRPRRHLRSSKACDYCHRRRIKCRISEEDPNRCQNCVDFDLKCESSRPPKRGNRSQSPQVGLVRCDRPSPIPNHSKAPQSTLPLLENDEPAPPVSRQGQRQDGQASCDPLEKGWKAFAYASVPLIKDLLGVYFETVYPIFPFFDRENLEKRLSSSELVDDRGFFSSVMAACALSSARVRDGALVSLSSYPPSLHAVPPETFFAAARDNLPTNMISTRSFDSLRACALLSIASIQNLEIDAMHLYIGHYFTLMATWGWHNESNWPTGLSPIEIEERRRLYWSLYTLDVFTSLVWDSCTHFQEGHAVVQYPSGVELHTRPPADGGWIVGWNFTTDLYRRLEHVLGRLRTRSSPYNVFAESSKACLATKMGGIRTEVDSLYSKLPERFRNLQPATGKLAEDIHGFQSANIQATLALFRIALLSLDTEVDLDKKCSVVSDVLDIFHQVPKAYQRAISTPLIYHMGGIGNILGSVMEAPLSESSYQRVRSLLLSMADLLDNLESFHKQQAGAARKLRDQVERIDAFMMSRWERSNPQESYEQNNLRPAQFPPLAGHVDELEHSEDMNSISPLFQIPDELLQNWDWTFNIYQSQFPYFGDNT